MRGDKASVRDTGRAKAGKVVCSSGRAQRDEGTQGELLARGRRLCCALVRTKGTRVTRQFQSTAEPVNQNGGWGCSQERGKGTALPFLLVPESPEQSKRERERPATQPQPSVDRPPPEAPPSIQPPPELASGHMNSIGLTQDTATSTTDANHESAFPQADAVDQQLHADTSDHLNNISLTQDTSTRIPPADTVDAQPRADASNHTHDVAGDPDADQPRERPRPSEEVEPQDERPRRSEGHGSQRVENKAMKHIYKQHNKRGNPQTAATAAAGRPRLGTPVRATATAG